MAIYQTYAPNIADTLAHWLLWAQFFGGGFTTLGWVAQTGHGELPATGTGASYAFTNPVLPVAATTAMALYTYRGAWVSGNTYPNGSNAANGTCDLVTDNASGGNGITYQKITTNVATNLTTAPHSNATDWLPCQFEIWKSAGSNTSSLPIYIKLVYTTQGAANNTIRTLISIGTGVDANGNLTNCIALSGTAPTNIVACDSGATTLGTLFEMDMSGDSDNVRMFIYRGSTTTTNQTIVIDRARDASGNATDAYWYCGVILNQGGSQQNRTAIMPNSSIGSGPITATTGVGWPGVIWVGAQAASLNMFGTNPPLPIFPLVGFVANPLLGAVGFHRPDVTDGSIIPVWTYGAIHNYMVNSGETSALGALDNQSSNGICPAILWE